MKKVVFLLMLVSSFNSFSMTIDEYVSTTKGYIKSCGALVSMVDDKAGKGGRYSQLIWEELVVRSSYYFSKYNAQAVTNNDVKK
ncbi:hypothetical protein L9W77_18675, partial [Vibrio aestuarianus]|nr:hypothetical protein [Vibrio aestuarianus]